MSEEFIDGFDGDFVQEPTYNIYKRFPWSDWQFGTVSFCYKKIYSGSLDKLNYLTKGKLKEQYPEEYL